MAKIRRSKAGLDPEDISRGKHIEPKVTNHLTIQSGGSYTQKSWSNYDDKKDYGKSNSRSGQKGSKKVKTTKVVDPFTAKMAREHKARIIGEANFVTRKRKKK